MAFSSGDSGKIQEPGKQDTEQNREILLTLLILDMKDVCFPSCSSVGAKLFISYFIAKDKKCEVNKTCNTLI